MKKITFILSLIFVLVLAANGYTEEAPQKVIDMANKVLVKYGTDPIIVKAVKAQNAQGITLASIQKKDQEWRKTAGIADYMKAKMESECGVYLKKLQKSKDFFAEIFVMDYQGANVAMTDKTSDFWQGDEAKFKNSFNNGSGAVFVDKVEFDESSQAYLVQISVPVMDGGKAIGAITFGIDVDRVE